jgi:phage recombination protein Bet
MADGRQLATISEGSMAPVLDAERVNLLKRTIAKDSTDEEFELFVQICKRTGLDPFARQIYAIKRWDSSQKRNVMQTQVAIDGLRLVAERTGKYAGQVGPYWCGKDGEWTDVWLQDEPPTAAKVGVLRHDWKETCWGIARFKSYAQTTKDGGLTHMWRQMPDLMIAKVAEALALRRAFPQELSGIYSSDEMAQADSHGVDVQAPAQSAPVITEHEPENVTADGEIIEKPEVTEMASEKQIKYIATMTPEAGYTDETLKTTWLKRSYGVESKKDLTKDQASEVIHMLQVTAFAERLKAAESERDLNLIAAEIKEQGITGDDRKVLGDLYKRRLDELTSSDGDDELDAAADAAFGEAKQAEMA